MGYGSQNNEGIMIKSDILGLKDMNAALQGVILKLRGGQCLINSNFSVSQKTWKERSGELNNETLHLLLDSIVSYSKSTKNSDGWYDKSYCLGILNDNMRFTRAHVDKMVTSGMLRDLLQDNYITMRSIDTETQKKLVDDLILETLNNYKGGATSNFYSSYGLVACSDIVPGLTLELYEYLKQKAEDAAQNLNSEAKLKEWKQYVLHDSIERDIPKDTDCALDIVEKYHEPLMRELLCRLRTHQALTLINLPVEDFTQYGTAEHKIATFVSDVTEYKHCPIEYIKKIIDCSELAESEGARSTVLELRRDDIELLQLELLLKNPKEFANQFRRSYNAREVFWKRFTQLFNSKPEFVETFRTMMLDPATKNLPMGKGGAIHE